MRRWVAVWIAGGEGSPRSLAMTRFRNWSKPASASSCRCSRICVRTWCSAMTDRTFRGPITNWSAAFVVSRRSIAGSVAARTGTATCCATDAASPTRPGGKRMPTDSTSSNSMPADSITVAGASCDGSPKPLRASNSSAFVSATSGRSTSTHLKLAGLPLLRRHFCPDGFFARPAHPSDGTPHRRGTHAQAVLLLPGLTVHLQGRVGVRLQLSNQASLQGRKFLGRPARNRSDADISCLAPLLQVPFDRGSRDSQELDNLASWIALIHGSQDLLSQIDGIGFHWLSSPYCSLAPAFPPFIL